MEKEEHMRLPDWRNTSRSFALVYVLTICLLQLSPLVCYAQNLGTQPATGQAVQGQTAAQPEGTVLNLVNWVGNVIAPVGAALAVVMGGVGASHDLSLNACCSTSSHLQLLSSLL